MNPTDFVSAIVSFFPWGFLKVAILVMVAMYTIFAAIIVRQEQLMARVVELQLSPFMRLVAITHFIASVMAFFLSLVLL